MSNAKQKGRGQRANGAPIAKVSGQALTEFLVLALALIPLFLLMPVIEKYQDLAFATQMASRYVAFDATTRNDSMGTWKPIPQLNAEVVRRFFGNADAPIKTNDVAGNFAADRNPFWYGPDGTPLIADFDHDVVVSFGFGHGTSQVAGFSSTSDGTPFSSVNGDLSLQARGVYTANVSVSLANMPTGLKFYRPLDTINLSMTRSTSLVFDPWDSKQPEDVEDRIGSSPKIFPAGQLAGIGSFVSAAVQAIDLPGGVQGPKLGQLSFWRDVVPEDRLRAN